MENAMRRCKKCQKEKSIDEFQITNKKRGWRRWECRECINKRHHHWNQVSKDRIRKYYANNRQGNIDRATKWNQENKARHGEIALAHYYRLQNEAIMAYGGYKCVCCGEREPLFLTIDHVNNDGHKHRKEIQSGDGLYKWLKQHNYPDGFQVLCMNCNHGKRRNNGICPHLTREGATTIPKGSRAKRPEAPRTQNG